MVTSIMNKKNNLPRRKISSGKVTGKVKYNTNLKLVTNRDSPVTDSFLYFESKFQFSDFYNKVIQDNSWITKPRFLLKAKNKKYYTNTPLGIELAFRDLISYYYNLDEPLQRLYDGYHDSMFVRFAIKSGIFTTQHHWEMIMRNWYEGFAMAVDVYYRKIHPKYDPSSNIPYTSFFDTHFPNRLYFEILNIEYKNKDLLEDCVEILRLDQISNLELHEYLYSDTYNLI